MGATGCGKSKLSIDLATRFFPSSEIINSDKIQVYNGLNITTNKISMRERRSVPHHLLGEFTPTESHPEFTHFDFRSTGSSRINEIINRGNVPFIVGGSNSFIYALLAKQFNSRFDIFEPSNKLSYNCCFIWVDVMAHVLNEYLDKRVDEMLDSDMLEELEGYFKKEGFSDSGSVSRGDKGEYTGIGRETGGEDRAVERSCVGPTKSRCHGDVYGGDDVRIRQENGGDRNLGKTGVGTKCQDYEEVLVGVGNSKREEVD
ncbi:hypothetical protein K7X08_031446 [Anisodus acutangulus]|uniref:Adenylate isopentenyltransferase n=1 Tax=Anisodus acutangulus TaxID=402998 RepID=A0A9Q1MQ43_9SOLA|nr:hypothetical protein K7X08_031446 [Anisodus acutangulus]